MRNFVKCFLEIEKDGVCLYSVIDIVCNVYVLSVQLCYSHCYYTESVLY